MSRHCRNAILFAHLLMTGIVVFAGLWWRSQLRQDHIESRFVVWKAGVGRREAMQLKNFLMADGSRHFLDLPETVEWSDLRDHIVRLSGAVVTGYLTDHITEVWIDFTYRNQSFTVNNQWETIGFSLTNQVARTLF